MGESAAFDVAVYAYLKNVGVNIFIDIRQIVQLESLCAGIGRRRVCGEVSLPIKAEPVIITLHIVVRLDQCMTRDEAYND